MYQRLSLFQIFFQCSLPVCILNFLASWNLSLPAGGVINLKQVKLPNSFLIIYQPNKAIFKFELIVKLL